MGRRRTGGRAKVGPEERMLSERAEAARAGARRSAWTASVSEETMTAMPARAEIASDTKVETREVLRPPRVAARTAIGTAQRRAPNSQSCDSSSQAWAKVDQGAGGDPDSDAGTVMPETPGMRGMAPGPLLWPSLVFSCATSVEQTDATTHVFETSSNHGHGGLDGRRRPRDHDELPRQTSASDRHARVRTSWPHRPRPAP